MYLLKCHQMSSSNKSKNKEYDWLKPKWHSYNQIIILVRICILLFKNYSQSLSLLEFLTVYWLLISYINYTYIKLVRKNHTFPLKNYRYSKITFRILWARIWHRYVKIYNCIHINIECTFNKLNYLILLTMCSFSFDWNFFHFLRIFIIIENTHLKCNLPNVIFIFFILELTGMFYIIL